MALINCYECGKQISDKALSCPHCGAPIVENNNNYKDNNAYSICFDGFENRKFYNLYRTKITFYTVKIYGKYMSELDNCINTNHQCVLFEGISKQATEYILMYMSSFGCKLRVKQSKVNIIDHQLDQKIKEVYEDSLILKCPRCKSTAITTGTKGYGLVRGFLGSNKTVNRCGNCGYSWEP